MSKIAFIYPGQGAQQPGMGKDFYEKGQLAQVVYDRAQQVLDFDIKAMCFGDDPRLNQTDFTQPALVTTCLAMTAEVMALGIQPDVTAGLSLGEYAAISAAGGMDEADAIRMVRARGIFMNEAVPGGKGSMMAVIGMSAELIESVIAPIEGVSIANYNCPGQIVITGERSAVETAGQALMAAGKGRVLPVNVSGPFHSPFLKGAGEKLAEELEKAALKPLRIPYVTNVTADYVRDISETKALLVDQVSSPVRWEQSMRRLIADGVDIFIEIGPGKTLAGFMKKIDRSVKVMGVSTYEDLERVKELVK